VGDGERHVEQPRQRFGQQRLARTGRTDQQNVALAQFDFFFLVALVQAFVMVVNSHCEDFLRAFRPMTYWSRMPLISLGAGSFCALLSAWASCTSSRMMSLHRSTHSSQIKTEGPAINLRTSCWLLPQKEQ